MDRCTVLLAPDVTDAWDICAWMALSSKLDHADFESYVDEAVTYVTAIVSED